MFKTSKKFFIYYLISSFLTLAAFTTWFYYFYSKGTFDTDKSAWIHEGVANVEEIKNLNPYNEIKSLINADQARDSYKVLEKIEKNLINLRLISDKSKTKDLKNSLDESKKTLNNVINHSEVQNMITVFQNKLVGFENFVELNRWKTLTRIALRSNQRLAIFKNKKNNVYSYERLKEFQASISQDLSTMISITEGSVLTADNKNKIIDQVKNLKTEIAMIDSYLNDLVIFEKSARQMSDLYKLWISDTYPKITFAKIEYERSAKTMAISAVGMIILCAVLLAIGLFTFQKDRNDTSSLLENDFVNLIKERVLSNKMHQHNQAASNAFNDEVNKLQDYVHKRMNFGSIFQSATPFSTILLDDNLNLVWGNAHFFEQWGLASQSARVENVTWNYLQQYTNLGEDDPVLSALKHKIAGIYQIQVRTNKNEDFLPYEMYVSPVENSEKTFIMLFFYPLRSLVETITNQTKALVGPISRTLDMLCAESFTVDAQMKIKKDYEIAGIDSIHQKFLEYFDYVQTQKKGLMAEISRLENTIYDQNKITDDLVKIVKGLFDKYQIMTNKFDELKGHIVKTVDGRNEVVHIFHACNNLFKTTFKDVQDITKSCNTQLGLINEVSKGLSSMVTLKDGLKQNKATTDDCKLRLNLSLDQASIFSRTAETSATRIDQAISKIKLEAKSLDKSVAQLLDGVSSFDVAVSKLLLVMEKHETPDIAKTSDGVIKAKSLFEDELFKLGKLEKDCAFEDERMINSLKVIYGDLIQFKKGLNQVGQFLNDSKATLIEGASLDTKNHNDLNPSDVL